MSTEGVQRVGVLGGTFDPIHHGHLAAAEEAWQALGLQRVYFVPNWQQPLKQGGAASPAHRLQMVQLAIAGNERFAVSTVEIGRPGPSYTLETLLTLLAGWGAGVAIYFLLGIDAMAQFPAWHQPAEIIRLCRLVVMSRSDTREPDWAALERITPGARERVDLLTVPDLDISATDLRRRLALGQPVRYQVPEAVREYIEAHHLYRGEGSGVRG